MVSKINDNNPDYYFFSNGIYEVRGAAGAGKTFQLVQDIKKLNVLQKKIAVISFSNAAIDELYSRTDNTHIMMSTVHSFAWNILSSIAIKILKLLYSFDHFEIQSLSGISIDQVKSVEYGELGVASFNQENSILWLSHDEVLKIFTYALKQIPDFSKLITNSFDYILIDEFQDTDSEFLEALFEHVSPESVIGLYGDPFQSIYLESRKDNLNSILESFKAKKFYLKFNYRSDKDLVDFFNISRSSYDNLQQIAKVTDYNINKIRPTVFISKSTLSNDKVSLINQKMQFEKSVVLSNTNGLKTKATEFGDIAKMLKKGILSSRELDWKEVLNQDALNFRIKALWNYSNLFFGSDYDSVVSLQNIFTLDSLVSVCMKDIARILSNQKKNHSIQYAELINLGLHLNDEYKLKDEVELLLSKINYEQLFDINRFYSNLKKINNGSSTIYSSKGLEFDNVILNIDYGYFGNRNWNILNFYHSESDKFNKDSDLMSYLFYVGITRAKHGLAIYVNTSRHPNFLSAFKHKFSSININYENL